MQQPTIVRSTRASRIGTIAAVLVVGLLTLAPWWTSPASMRLITEFLVYLALACMWNLLAGYAGLLSIGQHAYVGFFSGSARSTPFRSQASQRL
jgi:branched-chain amino acid transport system permease protein